MELSTIPLQLLGECITSTASGEGVDERELLTVLETRYPNVSALYTQYLDSITRLPRELSTIIMAQTSPTTLRNLAQTSREFARAYRDPALWYQRLKLDWGVQYDGTDPMQEYARLSNRYILYTKVPSICANLTKLLIRNLPDTVVADPLKRILQRQLEYELEWEGGGGSWSKGEPVPHQRIESVAWSPVYGAGEEGDKYDTPEGPFCGVPNMRQWDGGHSHRLMQDVHRIYPTFDYTFDWELVEDSEDITQFHLILHKGKVQLNNGRIYPTPIHIPARSFQPEQLPALFSYIREGFAPYLARGKNGLAPDAIKFRALLDSTPLTLIHVERGVETYLYDRVYTLPGKPLTQSDLPTGFVISRVALKIVYNFRRYYEDGAVPINCQPRNKDSLFTSARSPFNDELSLVVIRIQGTMRELFRQYKVVAPPYNPSVTFNLISGASSGSITIVFDHV